MIGIIDYGAGNLRNVYAAVTRAGYESVVTQDIDVLQRSSALILPGVGAFGDCMGMLNSTGIRLFLDRWVAQGGLLLGICVGMQLLFETSREFGEHEGLAYMNGAVTRFDEMRDKVPQIGWNQLLIARPDPLLAGVEEGEYVYFVHSYYADVQDECLAAYTDYAGVKAGAVVSKDNVWGTQFHPEKSSMTGAKILKNYLEMTP